MWAHWNNITVTKLIPNMFIPALHTRQTSSPHGIEESNDVLCGMACYSSWRATVSSSRFLGGLSRFLTLSLSNAHTFSTGLISGDFAGQSITTIPASARNAVQTLWQCVVEYCHAETSLPLHEWLHLLLQDFVPVQHSIEAPLDHKISMVQSRNPAPHHERCTPSISVCFTDAWVCQSFVSSFPHSPSSINPLKHERAFIWHQNLILNLILNLNLVFHIQGHKGEMTRFGSKVLRWSALWSAALAKMRHWISECFIKRPVTHWWFGPHS